MALKKTTQHGSTGEMESLSLGRQNQGRAAHGWDWVSGELRAELPTHGLAARVGGRFTLQASCPPAGTCTW